MVPCKLGKKKDASADDSNPNTYILLNTTSRITDAIKSWKHVYDILEHEILLYPNDSAEEEDELFLAKLRLVAQSQLHRIIARPKIIPYNEMISWALEHVDIQTRSIINYQNTFVGFFRSEDIQVMYNYRSHPNTCIMQHLFWILKGENALNMEELVMT
jgi:hypothetical protein